MSNQADTEHVQTALFPLLAQAATQVANPMMITDDAGRIVWANSAFYRLCGYAPDELLGRTPAILSSGRERADYYTRLWGTIRAGEVWRENIVDRRKDGTSYTADQIITPLRDEDGVIRHFIAVQQDVTEQERERDQDRYLASHDVLTGLPNRSRLLEAYQRVISHAKQTGQQIAMMFIDLDGFKQVNDQRGHLTGDQLLQAVADRLRSAVRQSDTLCRIGGDEFAVLVAGLDERQFAATLALKLLETLSQPFLIRGERFSIGASIGIAMFPADGDDATRLLEQADKAMYQAKRQGGNCHLFYPGTARH